MLVIDYAKTVASIYTTHLILLLTVNTANFILEVASSDQGRRVGGAIEAVALGAAIGWGGGGRRHRK